MKDPLSLSSLFSAFGNDLAAIHDRKDLLRLIATHLAPQLTFSDILLSVVNEDKQTHSVSIFHCDPARQENSDHTLLLQERFRMDDGVCNITMASPSPLVVDIAGILLRPDPPRYITGWYRPAISRMIAVRLRSHNQLLGALFLFLEKAQIGINDLELMQHFSYIIAPALKNIIVDERSLQQQLENETLLTLSTRIAGIKDRIGLLSLLRQLSQKHAFYSNLVLSILEEDKKTTAGFLITEEQRWRQHPDFVKESTARYKLNDGVLNTVLTSGTPLTFQLEEIMSFPASPSYVRFLYSQGIREVTMAVLRSKGAELGFACFLSSAKRRIGDRELHFLQRMCDQLGIAVANILAAEALQQKEKEQALLLSLSTDFVKIRDKDDLFQLLDICLRQLFEYDHCSIALVDKDKKIFKALPLLMPDPGIFGNDANEGMPYDGGLIEATLDSDHALSFDLDDQMSADAPEYIRHSYDGGMREVVMMALRKEDRSFGFLILFSQNKGWFKPRHLEIIRAISNQLSISFTNILTHEAILERENDKSFILSLSKDLTSTRNKRDFLAVVEKAFREILPYDEMTISRLNADGETHSAYLYNLKDGSKDHPDYTTRAAQRYPVQDGIYEVLLRSETPLIYDMDRLMMKPSVPPYVSFFYDLGMREMVAIPLRGNNEGFGGAFIYLKGKGLLTQRNLGLLQGLCMQISISVANIGAYEKIESQLEEIHHHKHRLEEENLYLQEQIRTAHGFTEIIGVGSAMQKVFQLVSIVSPSDSTVLILGETGTGKELVAKAIHEGSSRKSKFMVRVNCAALPANLVESELFGHEKDSFTGAVERRIGKFELANDSTLFLDEIGEIPLELQGKLLRAIQEKEIERIGGKGVVRTNVRIIAATNRNLSKEVEAGRFRSDLFYRLNAFPIQLPPLRERKEDLPMLASHFISQQTQRAGKKIANISQKALESLMRYDWPGNVRELEHLIERSILMTSGPTIKDIPLPNGPDTDLSDLTGNPSLKTLDELERDHILAVLKKCNHKIGGPGGAAELLRLPATTLHSKIKKLGIKKNIE